MKKIIEAVISSGRTTRNGPRWSHILLSGAAVLSCAVAQAQATVPDTMVQRTMACAACHGAEGRVTADGYYPRIAGKPAGYLYNQLINFREGRRQNPMMIYMVDHLSDAYLKEIAGYFSGLSAVYPVSKDVPQPITQRINVSSATIERGRILATLGDVSKNVPACIACHGTSLTGTAPGIPGLIGLPRDYLNAQFGAWKNGTRRAAAPDCMAQLAARLSVEDISAASAWLASQPVPADPSPLKVANHSYPMDCGSTRQ